MKTKAAVVYEPGKPIEVVELDLAGPEEGEVLVRFTHAGLCHSDVRVVQGDSGARLPMVLGHEGAGIVEEVGHGVTRVKPGDHFVGSFIASCGTCRWCSAGQQSICDMGALTHQGHLPSGRFPFTGPGPVKDHGSLCLLGTFSQYSTLHQNSVVRIDKDLPLDKAALVGCGVPTGWGSAVNTAQVRPGDTVMVVGTGGIGINAVQGARQVGATTVIAVDPLAFKREKALELGATHAFASVLEAMDLARSHTNGNGADKVILTADVLTEELITNSFHATGKAGTLVLTGLSNIPGNLRLFSNDMTYYRKSIKGSLYGDCNPTVDIPRLLGMYRSGDLKLDEIITNTYTLDTINQGYDDLHDGKNLRGVLVHDRA
jgi:S-(hydroxymethyl)glutathione dehydrogenase/alcohol dehydrogenase